LSNQIQSVLDHLWATPEPEVRTFSEAMRTPSAKANDGRPDQFENELMANETAKVRSAVYVKQQSGGVIIEHGWHADDYVWHIEPAPKRAFSVSMDRVLFAITRTFNTVIPSNIKVDVMLPFADWDRKIITFKAYGLDQCWNVSDSDLNRLVVVVFKVLNTLIK